MIYYAIKNKKTGRYVSGTNFNYSDGKPRQIMHTSGRPPKLFTGLDILLEIKCRDINLKHYDVVAVQVKEVAP